jgi:predicted metalloprotease with PDZ domain
MRTLWQRYGRDGRGVPEGGLEQIAAEISGLDLKRDLDRWLRSTEPLPLVELLAQAGVKAEARAAVSEADGGGRVSGKPLPVSLGLKLRGGETVVAFVTAGSPAQVAGISAGDQLVAVDRVKITPGNWSRHLLAMRPERDYLVYLFRGDELIRVTVRAEAPPLDTWTVTLASAEGDVLARRKAWLGS